MSSFNDWLHRNYPNTVDYKIAHHINDDMEEAYNAGMERAAEIAINLFAGRDDFKKEYDAGFDIEDAIRKEIT